MNGDHLEPRLRAALRKAVSLGCALAISIGLAGLAGWALSLPARSRVVFGEVAIGPITSSCFALLGISGLLLAESDARAARTTARIGRLLAMLAMLAGAASLSEYVPRDAGGIGYIDPIAALGVVLIGLGLLTANWTIGMGGRRYWPAHAFAFLSGMAAIVGLLDFALGGAVSYTHVALPTAVGLFALSAALVCVRPDYGLGALLASASLGGALTRRLWPAAVIVPMLLGMLSWRVHSAGLLSEWGALTSMILSMIALLGGLVVWNGHNIDRTDRLRRVAERALFRRERELQEAHRLARVGSWFWEPKTNQVSWSPELYRIVGRDPRLPPPTLHEQATLFEVESAARLKAAFEVAQHEGNAFELDLVLAGAEPRYVIARGEVECDAESQTSLMRGTLQDITERKLSQLELARIHRAQQALSRCNQALIRALDEATLLQQVCDIVVDTAGYRSCWVGLAVKGKQESILPAARAGLDASYLESLKLDLGAAESSEAPVSTCIRTREMVVIVDIASDPRTLSSRSAALSRGYASSVAIPLLVDEIAVGALEIFAAGARAFGTREIELLSELAGDLAFGIKALRTKAAHERAEAEVRALNAELEERVLARTAELCAVNDAKDALLVEQRATSAELSLVREREADVGFRIQQTLLLDAPPCDMPGLHVFARTLPSQRVDGDFYAFISPRDQVLDVIVGDVMGKGIVAALLGAATKSHFSRALADLAGTADKHSPPRPQDVVMLAHAGLARHLIELDSFVTLCYARLDLIGRRLDFVDCGHTGILLLEKSTGRTRLLHGDNLPLGVREGEIYRQISVPLMPGDTLLLFSDEITDARDATGMSFGFERLEQCARENAARGARELIDAVAAAVSAFAGGGRPSDDQTSVAIRIDGAALPLWHGEVEIRSDLKELVRAREFVRRFCREAPGQALDAAGVGALELAVNEAASNIMKHAYDCHADQPIQIDADAYADRVSMRLRHVGSPFSPESVQEPAFNGSRESGFGTYIISSSVDDVRYYRDASGRSCVALVKKRTYPQAEFEPWT